MFDDLIVFSLFVDVKYNFMFLGVEFRNSWPLEAIYF